MQVITTLTDDLSNIRPPLVIIEYDDVSSSDLGKGILVQVRNMNKISCVRVEMCLVIEHSLYIQERLLYSLSLALVSPIYSRSDF